MSRTTLTQTPDAVITVRMPSEIAERIDELRSPTRMPRNTWILQAVMEKLERLEEEERRKEIERRQNVGKEIE